MRRWGWHRLWRNHRRGRHFWQHPKAFWFPSGIPIAVLCVLLWLASKVIFRDPERGVSDAAAMLGLGLALAIIVLSLIRLVRRKQNWRGHHRSRSTITLVGMIVYVISLTWFWLKNR